LRAIVVEVTSLLVDSLGLVRLLFGLLLEYPNQLVTLVLIVFGFPTAISALSVRVSSQSRVLVVLAECSATFY
jgi:hypothetical protein